MKSAYLIFVESENNHNKFYEATLNDDRSIDVKYGRVGSAPAIHHYRAGEKDYDSLIDSKLRKGYVERTALHVDSPIVRGGKAVLGKPIADAEIQALVSDLIRKARQFVSTNYTISHDAITKKMIEEAKADLSSLCLLVHNRCTVSDFNRVLTDIFQDVPRRMSQVSAYLAKTPQDFGEIISREQGMLDNLEGQVQVLQSDKTEKQTVLEENDLTVTTATYEEEDTILKTLTRKNWQKISNEDRFLHAYQVGNKKTEEKFQSYCKEHNLAPHHGRHLYFHGTKIENLWSIFRMGLQLHPNASVTGKAFGQGIYFAEHSQKSIGYTSMQGSTWAKGTESTGLLLLYEVAVGKSYITDHTLNSSFNEKNLKALGDYQSVYAPSVYRNSECMIYNQDQCTIRYAVEISSQKQNFILPFEDRMKLRFTNCFEKETEKNGQYWFLLKEENLSKDSQLIFSKITTKKESNEPVFARYCPDTKEMTFVNKKGKDLVRDVSIADKKWIARQIKREFADSDKAFEEKYPTTKEKTKNYEICS